MTKSNTPRKVKPAKNEKKNFFQYLQGNQFAL